MIYRRDLASLNPMILSWDFGQGSYIFQQFVIIVFSLAPV